MYLTTKQTTVKITKINAKTLISSTHLNPIVNEERIVEYEEYTSNELLDLEYQSYGFYIDNHPVSKYIRDNTCTLKNIVNSSDCLIHCDISGSILNAIYITPYNS